MSSIAVLLTATIHCEGIPFVERNDPRLREEDYKWALKGWLETTGFQTLIFCENSGAPLDRLKQYASKFNRFGHRLVFLSCNGNLGASEFGKGYGEIEIIRHAMERSPNIDLHQLIVKVTGRYRARNATRLFSKLAATEADLFCSLRMNLTEADSRLFAITPKCIREQLLSRQTSINDHQGRFFEHVLADAVHGTILTGGRWAPLPCDPLVYGVSGTFGTKFGSSPIWQMGKIIRHTLVKTAFDLKL